MTKAGHTPEKQRWIDDQLIDESETCWQRGGEGGWNSCMEDCCPALGGEDGCDDPACWYPCDICRAKGAQP